MAHIQKGIQEVSYKQKDGTVITKYRVRINKKELKLNKLVDSLDIANEIINNSKTIIGKNALNNFLTQEEQQAFDEYERSQYQLNDSLEALLEAFNEKHFIRKHNDLNELDKMSNRKYRKLIKNISALEITDNSMFLTSPVAVANAFADEYTIKFGELNPLKMTSADIASYIDKRLETVAKATVKRELNYISSFFNNFSNYYSKYEVLKDINPVRKVNKKALKNAFIKRDRRLSEEEETKLLTALQSNDNKSLVIITVLALLTGMRKSEIMLLKKGDLKDNYIQLYKTKNGLPRKVKLLPEAQIIVSKLIKDNEHKKLTDKVFKLTIEGFNSQWQRIKKSTGIEDFKFQDLRSEFISRALEEHLNPMSVSELANINDIAYFEKTHLFNHEENLRVNSDNKLNERDTQRQVGHLTKGMTKHYTRNLIDNITKKIE
ncbi:tyrosine-type recombinase/integrase [Methylophilus methylotrophus]|uniref:tyrosine-type recombinase/integrase n=1 Tax=Methylophilus methylotrophus TaxID=17 RepID=UPI000378C6D4|nr:site-specific integrase [Methylophilus methylotrophus]